LEWAWRSLTYWEKQPFIKQKLKEQTLAATSNSSLTGF
jgi:hypothetical protein